MSTSLAVLALDAADYRLARQWNCENMLLSKNRGIETFSYSYDHPFTPEVWTSIATGLQPEEHSVYGDAADWNSLPLRLVSKFTQYLPHKWRNLLGKPFRERGHEQHIHQSNKPHAFERGAVFGWPGISQADHLSEAWSWASKLNHGEMDMSELRSKTLGNTGKELGWLVGMQEAGIPIFGVHSHILDITGHAFANRKNLLREYYEYVDSMLSWVRDQVDELVIISDHGMQVSWLKDDSPGTHSDYAMFAATAGVEGELPESVFDVRAWLEANTEAKSESDRQEGKVGMDTAEERLRELGYIE